MTLTTIADALKSNPETILPGVRGIIKTVCERYPAQGMNQQTRPDGTVREWSLQSVVIEQGGAEILVECANKDPILADKVGQHVFLLAHQKSRGGLSGLKVAEDGGTKLLRLSASGELAWAQPGSELGSSFECPSCGKSRDRAREKASCCNPHCAEFSAPAAASPAASCVAGAASTSVPVTGPSCSGTESAGGRAVSVIPALAPSPNVEQACRLYEEILRRVLAIQVADNSGAVIDPQAATDTIFRALISRTS
jgi:hypothetical protein